MSSSTTSEGACRIAQDFDILRKTEVFSSAPAEITKLFAYLSRHRLYQPGETIIAHGQKADCSFYIIRGAIEIIVHHRGRDIVIQRLGDDSFFGELALLAHFTWFFTARATTPTELLIINRECYKKILEKYPEKREILTEKIIQLRIARFKSQTASTLDHLIADGIGEEADGKMILV